MNIDALCIPSHKGLLGPQGCGAVIFGGEIKMNTLIEGGNGVDSLESAMSYALPERYESGTLPLPAIAGLSAGIDSLRSIGIERICEHEKRLFCRAREELSRIDGVEIYTPHIEGAVLLFNIRTKGSEEIAQRLSEAGICVRGGYHCAALGHKTLGTDKSGGVRVSFGPFNSSGDVDALCAAVKEISRGS
jgi:selenocysteine lyase/cysteine desulfurase